MAHQPINDQTILASETSEKGEKVNKAESSREGVLEKTKKEVAETIKGEKSNFRNKKKDISEKKENTDQIEDDEKGKPEPKLEKNVETKLQETKSDDTKKLTEALVKKDEELVKFQKDFEEKMQEMGTNQKKIEEQMKNTKEDLLKQLTEKDKKIQELQKEISIKTSKFEVEKPKVEKKSKTTSKFSKDPVQRVAGTATGIVGGVGAIAMRTPAKVFDMVASPGQIFKKQFWKDSRKNLKSAPKNVWKTLTSGVRKTDETSSINMQKSYTKGRGPYATKDDPRYKKRPKRTARLAGKAVRGPVRLAQTALNVVGDTFDAIKKKKWSWNPKNWFTGRGKNADYSRTKESWNNLRRDPKKPKKKK